MINLFGIKFWIIKFMQRNEYKFSYEQEHKNTIVIILPLLRSPKYFWKQK